MNSQQPYAFQVFHLRLYHTMRREPKQAIHSAHPKAGNFPVCLEGPAVGALAAMPVNVAVLLCVLAKPLEVRDTLLEIVGKAVLVAAEETDELCETAGDDSPVPWMHCE